MTVKSNNGRVTHKEVVQALKGRGTVGKPVPVDLLASYLGIRESHSTFPKTRKLIRKAIAEGCPIGSCSDGYFITTNKRGFNLALKPLLSRQNALNERITNLRAAFLGAA